MHDLPQMTQNWIATLNLNQWIIDKQLDGITHDESMMKAPFRANRMNWVLGHLVEHRDWMLRAVDEVTLLPAKDVMLYRRGSEALDDNSPVVETTDLIALLRQAKDCLVMRLGKVDETFLMEKPQTGILLESHKDKTRFERLQGLLWHETYHVGQLELLRQLTGKNDAVI